MSIKGKSIGGPPSVPDFAQTDDTASDFIKNKPKMEEYAKKTYVDSEIDSATKKVTDEVKRYSDDKHFETTATLVETKWSDSTPYTQTITVAGLLATDEPHVSPVYSDDLETAMSQQEAWGTVSKAVAAVDAITFTCFEEKPTTDIPIQLEVNR